MRLKPLFHSKRDQKGLVVGDILSFGGFCGVGEIQYWCSFWLARVSAAFVGDVFYKYFQVFMFFSIVWVILEVACMHVHVRMSVCGMFVFPDVAVSMCQESIHQF